MIKGRDAADGWKPRDHHSRGGKYKRSKGLEGKKNSSDHGRSLGNFQCETIFPGSRGLHKKRKKKNDRAEPMRAFAVNRRGFCSLKKGKDRGLEEEAAGAAGASSSAHLKGDRDAAWGRKKGAVGERTATVRKGPEEDVAYFRGGLVGRRKKGAIYTFDIRERKEGSDVEKRNRHVMKPGKRKTRNEDDLSGEHNSRGRLPTVDD